MFITQLIISMFMPYVFYSYLLGHNNEILNNFRISLDIEYT